MSLEKTLERSISGFPNSVFLCSQKFCGLPEMVKNPFWYKKYKHINWLKVSINFSKSVVYSRLLNRFSGGLLNDLLILRLHPENFRKNFKTLGGCFWHLTFIKFWYPKKENYCNVAIPPLFFSRYVFPKPKVLVCLKTRIAIFTVLNHL